MNKKKVSMLLSEHEAYTVNLCRQLSEDDREYLFYFLISHIETLKGFSNERGVANDSKCRTVLQENQ